ncbi:hypothetical protein SLA2020_211260 [Shorea laevis]
MSVTEVSQGQHVAVLAFPYGGHGLTMISLTRRLASAAPNVQFSFFSTAKSNARLFPVRKSSINAGSIRPFNVDDGMPLNHVVKESSPEAVELFLKAAPVSFKKAMDTAVSETGRGFSCLLTDAFLAPFADEMAAELQVPWIPLYCTTPYDLSANVYTDLIRQRFLNSSRSHGNDETIKHQRLDFVPGLSLFQVMDLPQGILPTDSSKESLLSWTLSKTRNIMPKAAAIVINFCQELYPVPLQNDLYSLFPNLLNVGFLTLELPPPRLPPSSSDETGCLSWLDTRNPKSVVYIAFGTVSKLPPAEIMELAAAVEESQIPFLWVLDENSRQFLPTGFLENVSSFGKFVSWAPQTQVLGHPSTGVFITHSGSNSVFESIANEVPMICRPFFGDQPMNGRLVEEVWGIGVRIKGLVLTKSGVVKSLKLVLEDEVGKKMREKIHELNKLVLKAAAPNGRATQDFKSLVELILIL